MTFTNLKEAYEAIRSKAMSNRNKPCGSCWWVYLSYVKTESETEIIIDVESGNTHPIFRNPNIVTVGPFGDEVMKMADIQKALEEAKAWTSAK